MPQVETSARSFIDRLLREGWASEGGTKHDKFAHPSKPGIKIMVPRHRTLSPGTSPRPPGGSDFGVERSEE